MPTKKKTHFTITEAAKKKGVSRAAIFGAIRKGRLEAEWGETVQVIKKKSRLILAKSLEAYHPDSSHQERGKKS